MTAKKKISKKKSGQDSYFIGVDSHRMYYQIWKPRKKSNIVLIFVHGLNEHSGRYNNPIQFFSKKYTIYAYDQRGHGRSDGHRSHVEDFDHYLEDLNTFVQKVLKEAKGKKVFLIGHSMGGQIVLNYVGRYKPKLAGFLTSSANVEMALKVSDLKKKLGKWVAQFLPRFPLPNEIDPKWISRDKEVVKAYKKDPLVSKNITLNLAKQILLNQESLMSLASKIKLPALIMHAGDDHICAAKGSEKFYKKLASKDKTLKIYDGFYHEIFNEIGKEQVFKDMTRWLEKH